MQASEQPPFGGNTGGCGGKAALCRLPDAGGHIAADLVHGIDDLVQRNEAADAGQRHIGRRNGHDGIHTVALDARHLHQTGHRVTGQTQTVFQGVLPQHLAVADLDVAKGVTVTGTHTVSV